MKGKSNMPFLIRSMGPFKITMVFSIVFAALSAVENIYAYTYVYKIAQELILNAGNIKAINAGLLAEYGKGIVFAVCAAYGLYGISLLFSHITAFNTIMRLKRKLIKHIGTLPGGFHDSNPSGSLRKLIEKNTDATETMMAHQIPNTTMSIVLPIAFVVFMFRYSVLLSVACLIPVIIGFVLLMAIMMGNGGEFVHKYQQASKDMSNAAPYLWLSTWTHIIFCPLNYNQLPKPLSSQILKCSHFLPPSINKLTTTYYPCIKGHKPY